MKTRSWILAIGLGLSLFGCTPKDQTSSKIKIGFVLDNMNEERYAKDREFFTKKAEEYGAEVFFDSANSDVSRQLAKVENMLSLGVKALVIQPVDSNASATLIKAAKAEGVAVIAYDRIMNGAPIDLYVTQDSFRVGVIQAEAAVKATNGKGNFVILSGAQGHSVAEAITSGVKSVLAQYHPQIQIVTQAYHPGWSAELALRTVEDSLTRNKNNIQAVLANNSGMARGAVQAVAEQNMSDKVFIAGADADLAAIKNMVIGKQQFEVLKDIKPLAEAAAAAAVRLARGEQVDFDAEVDNGSGVKVKVINTPVYPITLDNIEEKIIQTGFHAREAVYGSSSAN